MLDVTTVNDAALATAIDPMTAATMLQKRNMRDQYIDGFDKASSLR